MPDFSLCSNKDCPIKESCYRATAMPSEYNQSYAIFYPNQNEQGEILDCDFHVPIPKLYLRKEKK